MMGQLHHLGTGWAVDRRPAACACTRGKPRQMASARPSPGDSGGAAHTHIVTGWQRGPTEKALAHVVCIDVEACRRAAAVCVLEGGLCRCAVSRSVPVGVGNHHFVDQLELEPVGSVLQGNGAWGTGGQGAGPPAAEWWHNGDSGKAGRGCGAERAGCTSPLY